MRTKQKTRRNSNKGIKLSKPRITKKTTTKKRSTKKPIKKRANKQEQNEKKLSDHIVLDNAGVIGVLNLKQNDNNEHTINKYLKYKLVGLTNYFLIQNNQEVIITPQKTKLSYDYYKKAREIINILTHNPRYKDNLDYYATIDEEGRYKSDEPVMISRGSVAVIIAPRVNNE